MNEKRQRGAGKIATLIWLAIIVAGVYLAFKIVPAYVNNYELQGLMQREASLTQQEARTAASSRQQETSTARNIPALEAQAKRGSTLPDFMKPRSSEQVRDAVFNKIKELDIPAKREDIQVESLTGGFRISVKYSVAVALPGYTLTLNFNPTAAPKAP